MSGNGSNLPGVNTPVNPTAPTPNTNPNSTFALPKIPEAAMPPMMPSPTVDGKPTVDTKTGEAAEAAPPSNPTTTTKAAVNPEGAMADSGSAIPAMPGALPPQGMPALPLPGAIGVPDASILPPPIPSDIPVAATSLPEISVERAKPRVQTWQTKLAPSIIPPKTNFNYRRQLLPESIYAVEYSRDNSHLPIRETREDYEAMLFSVVAKNDIDATRALLNAGTGLEITNSYGETPLAVAKRSGATEVAQLLTARGAQ